jgi:hypothetical protein
MIGNLRFRMIALQAGANRPAQKGALVRMLAALDELEAGLSSGKLTKEARRLVHLALATADGFDLVWSLGTLRVRRSQGKRARNLLAHNATKRAQSALRHAELINKAQAIWTKHPKWSVLRVAREIGGSVRTVRKVIAPHRPQ